MGLDVCGDKILVFDGFCLILLESPPSRVPASRKPPDNHVFGDRIVRTCNIHPVFYNNNRLCGGCFVGIWSKDLVDGFSYSVNHPICNIVV